MRAGFWVALDARLHEFFGQATQERLGESDRILKAISVLNDHVDAIEPARVDLTQEMADDIVRKIHGPLTIPERFSRWIREQAKHCDVTCINPLGYGPYPCTVQYYLKSDGTMMWQFRDVNGQPLWERTFVPPGFGA